MRAGSSRHPTTLAIVCTASVLGAIRAGAGEFPFVRPVHPTGRVQVVARRGAEGLAPYATAPAIERSIDNAVDWIEVEVRSSRDGRHVLVGDDDLSHSTDGKGPVSRLTLAELKRLDAGSHFAPRYAGTLIMELGEALKLARGRINVLLECEKVDAARLSAEVVAARMQNQVVFAGTPDVLKKLRATQDGGQLGLLLGNRAGGLTDANFDGLSPAVVSIPASDATAGRCRGLHERGIVVLAEAIGDADRPEVWDRAIEAGADWILSDRPEEIVARESILAAGASRVKISHHRGASHDAPENTLTAFDKAARLGADFVEFDIRTSRDGIPFLLHDALLDRTTNGRGPIREWDSAEINKLDAGAWFGRQFAGTPVPTLDAFLGSVPAGVELYVDAKDVSPENLVAALRKHALIERSVVYQGADYLAKLKAIEPTLRRMAGLGDASDVEGLAVRLEPYAFDARWSLLSKPLIDDCHARGILVFSDALGLHETAAEYRRAIDAGVDLIQTDHPIRVLRAIAGGR
ncbi:glycerophosphodiester phosphodiesterase family protein [Isosphaeraceae bacterium EP7]